MRFGAKTAIKYLVMVPVLAWVLFPLYWTLLTALKYPGDQKTSPPVMWTTHWRWTNFPDALFKWNGSAGLIDSAIVTLATTAISVALGVAAGYAIARFRVGGRNLSFFILSMLFMPQVAVVIPLFLLWRMVDLVDTHIALIVTYTVFNVPFVTWIMKGFFEELPRAPEEAALVLGASRLRALWEVAVPQVRAGVVVTTLFTIFFSWNEFIYSVILGKERVTTLPFIIPSLMESHNIEFGAIGAIVVLAAVPVIALAFALQRYLIRGLSFGLVREPGSGHGGTRA
jgi:multiple sugar transport system permease protein